MTPWGIFFNRECKSVTELTSLLKLNVVPGIQVQKICYITLLYAINIHNVQCNLKFQTFYTFDEDYRNKSWYEKNQNIEISSKGYGQYLRRGTQAGI